MKVENITIIGSGPAGISSAIQLKRYGITPVLLEKNEIGGLLRNANLVENYPGFPGGISGVELVNLFERHLKGIKIKVHFENTTNIDLEKELFRIETTKEVFYSRILVIASGTKVREFTDCPLPDEVKDKILYEIHPIIKVRDSKIVIVGAGDAAFDYALNLGKNNEVVILNRGNTLKCLPLLWERAIKTPTIAYMDRTSICKVINDSENLILLECKNSKGILNLHTNYIVFATGREPQLDFLSKRLKENITKMEGEGLLYLIGDVKNNIYRQTAIAVGDGIMAAMKIHNELKQEKI
jgi:thioredoxin reductase